MISTSSGSLLKMGQRHRILLSSRMQSTHQRTRFYDVPHHAHAPPSSFNIMDMEALKMATRIASRMLAWYSKKLDTQPLLTKGISSGIIAGTGDFLCQSFFVSSSSSDDDASASKNKTSSSISWDPARTARFGILGAMLVAPCIHFWYMALAARVPGTSVSRVVQRVFWDQFLYTPCFLPIWLTSLWAMEGERSPSVVVERLKESMPVVMMANWTLWIPAQTLNFAMVPLRYQVLYSNVVALLWNVFLSHSQSNKSGQDGASSTFDELDEVVPT